MQGDIWNGILKISLGQPEMKEKQQSNEGGVNGTTTAVFLRIRAKSTLIEMH